MPEQQQTLSVQKVIDLAAQHHKEGRLSQAETIYQQILQSDPNQPIALHLLGVIAHQTGKNDVAVDLITRAIAIDPDLAEAHSNLGTALRGLGKLEEAVTSYHKALAGSASAASRAAASLASIEDIGVIATPRVAVRLGRHRDARGVDVEIDEKHPLARGELVEGDAADDHGSVGVEGFPGGAHRIAGIAEYLEGVRGPG
jgi:tetratricopeptide (TPR) repeat protein